MSSREIILWLLPPNCAHKVWHCPQAHVCICTDPQVSGCFSHLTVDAIPASLASFSQALSPSTSGSLHMLFPLLGKLIPTLERPILQPVRPGLQVACSSHHLIWECTPSLSVLFLSRVSPQPISLAKIVMQIYCIIWLVSLPLEGKLQTNEFPCFTFLYCSWDLG